MALDPNDPMQQALYPVPADLVWPPPEYAGLFSFGPEAAPTPEQLALTEYGLPSTGAVIPGQPPPPPPPPVKRFGGQPPIEETAGPVPGAMPALGHEDPHALAASPMAPEQILQPGLGIPAATLDNALRSAHAGAPDPWEVLDTGPRAAGDDQRLSQALGALDERRPEMPPEYVSEQELGAGIAGYARQDPAGYAAFEAGEEEKKRLHFAKQAADVAARDAEQMRANNEIRQQAMKRADEMRAQVQHESDNLAADGGFWDSRTDGQKLLGLLSIGVGAFVAGPGGRNQALEIWEKSIDRHVASAKRKLADKQSGVAQMYQRLGDDFLANETMRQGVMKASLADLASQEQLYDPRGTTARKIAAARVQVAAKLSESEQRAAEHAQKQFIEAAKFQLDVQKQQLAVKSQADTARHQKAEEGLGWGRLAFDKAKQKEDAGLKRDEIAAKRDEKLGELDREQGVGGVLSVGQDGKPVYGALTNADGKQFHSPKEEHPKILKSRQGLLNLLDASSQLKVLREKAGGANRFTSPSDQAEYNRLTKRAVFDFAAANGLSTADEASMNAIRDRLFGGDPSGYNVGDAIGRIDRSMEESKNSYYNQLKGAGYTGAKEQAIQFVDTAKYQNAPLTADEQDYKDLFVDTTYADGDTRARLGLGPATGEGDPAVTPSQKRTLEALRMQALADPNARTDGKPPTPEQVASRNEQRKVALERLREAATNGSRRTSHDGPFGLVAGDDFGIAVEAQRILDSIISSGLDLEDPRATQKGARDTLDPRAVR